MRLLELRCKEAFNVLLVEDGKVVGYWNGREPRVLRDYWMDRDDPEAISNWDETWPDETDPERYGDLVSDAHLCGDEKGED